MKDYFKSKTWLITTLMFFIASGLSSAIVYYEFGYQKNIKVSRAGVGDNVSGFAWNSNIGWISFNSTDCDKNSDGFVDTNAMTNGCNGNGDNTTPVQDYGVSINSGTGNFSGYAWSSSVGWISFNEINPPDDYAFNANCKNNSCKANVKCTACYNSTDSGKVYGWARILSYKSSGVDNGNGWIKLRNEPDYGASINPTDPPTVANMIAPNWSYYQASTDIRGALHADLKFSFANFSADGFSGWAWNANDDGSGIGWTSFNCDHTNDGTLPPNKINTCATSNYKVIGGGASNGSVGKYYQIIVNTHDDVNDLNPTFDSGKCTYPSADAKCKIDIFCLTNISSCQYSLGATEHLDYGTAYYWWVMVWDENGRDSGLVQYNTQGVGDGKDTPAEADDGAFKTFTTYKHEFPDASATYFPLKPSQGEKVKFTDTSSIYKTAAPTVAVPCDASRCTWLWTVDGLSTDYKINDQSTSTPIIIFNSTKSYKVTLRVKDVDGYYTDFPMTVDVNVKLPSWEEVKPE